MTEEDRLVSIEAKLDKLLTDWARWQPVLEMMMTPSTTWALRRRRRERDDDDRT